MEGRVGVTMTDALSIALSGLTAQSRRLSAAASNIANAGTVGALPAPESPASTVYKPLSVSYTALTSGGVSAQISEDAQGYSPVYDPSSPYANQEGLIAAPNVDFNQEVVSLMTTKTAYKANISVIKTQDQMMGDLLDALS